MDDRKKARRDQLKVARQEGRAKKVHAQRVKQRQSPARKARALQRQEEQKERVNGE
jgi:hypothetical protein